MKWQYTVQYTDVTDLKIDKGVFNGSRAPPIDHALITGKHFIGCYTGELQTVYVLLVRLATTKD